jgi:hypothetical protein
MITFSGRQASISSKEARASPLRPKNVSLTAIGVLPSGSSTPASRNSHT